MYRLFLKRVIDLIMALVALPFLVVLLLIIGPIIYFQDKGPIFYNAPRLGKNGKTFLMYKLRSMKKNAPDVRNNDGSTFNAMDDPRLTKIGKFIRKTSIDEMPQILNIIKGDMSLIGPRPDLPEHRKQYVGNESRKLEVKPGITGLNQAYYRNTVPWKERIQYDIFYIDHLTLWLDIKIFFKTISTVLLRKTVFVSTQNSLGDEKNSNASE